jgi:hypothetical protein
MLYGATIILLRTEESYLQVERISRGEIATAQAQKKEAQRHGFESTHSGPNKSQ